MERERRADSRWTISGGSLSGALGPGYTCLGGELDHPLSVVSPHLDPGSTKGTSRVRREPVAFRTGKRSARRSSGVALAVLLILIISVTIGVALFRPGPGITTDCTAYGIPADDPRAAAPEIQLVTDQDSPSPRAEDPTTRRPWRENWGGSVDGVILGERHRAGDIRSRYHVFTRGIDFSEPVGLLVRLHGDGAEEYHHPDGLSNCLAVVASSHNLITLVPRSPDLVTGTWWEDLPRTLPWLTDLVREVSRDYEVDTGRIWWMGYSGGAEMLSYGVIPTAPELVSGGAVLLGGGGAPTALELTVPAELRETMQLSWVTGRRDDGTDPREPFDAIEAATEGAAWYRDNGFTGVSTEFPAEHDHFTLPQVGIMAEHLDRDAADS